MDLADYSSEREEHHRQHAIESARREAIRLKAIDIESIVCDDCEDDGHRGKLCDNYAQCLKDWERLQRVAT